MDAVVQYRLDLADWKPSGLQGQADFIFTVLGALRLTFGVLGGGNGDAMGYPSV
jgi:hypothetical protein